MAIPKKDFQIFEKLQRRWDKCMRVRHFGYFPDKPCISQTNLMVIIALLAIIAKS